jgi:hypothetical protein
MTRLESATPAAIHGSPGPRWGAVTTLRWGSAIAAAFVFLQMPLTSTVARQAA